MGITNKFHSIKVAVIEVTGLHIIPGVFGCFWSIGNRVVCGKREEFSHLAIFGPGV